MHTSILRFLAQGRGFGRESGAFGFWGFQGFQVLWSLRTAQNRPERAQSRSESPRAVAQSCSRHCSGSPRARPELVRAAQGRPERAQSCSEPLRIAWSVLRAAQSRSESPRAVAQSCSKNRSGSSVSHALCISDAQFYFTWFPLLRACICTGSR